MATLQPDDDPVLTRFLPAAWRLAMVCTGDATQAEEATIAGVVEAVTAADRDGAEPTGTAIVAATRRAVLTKGAAAESHPSSSDNAVVAAFRALGEKARAAVWLTEVEGGTTEQVAPVLGLHPETAGHVCDRASAALRANLAGRLASGASDEACRSVLGRIHLHAAGRLPDDARREVSHHLAGCRSCSVRLALVVAPRPLLGGAVTEFPASLAQAVAARLADRPAARRSAMLSIDRRSLGAAAAVVVLGIGATAVLGGGDTAGEGPELAAPAAVELSTPVAGVRSTLTTPTGPSVAVIPVSVSRPDDTPTSPPTRAIDRARSLGSLPLESPPAGDPSAPGPGPSAPAGPMAPPTAPPTSSEKLLPETTVPVPDPLPDLVVPEVPGLPPEPTPIPCTGIPELDALVSCTPSTTSDPLAPLDAVGELFGV